MNFKPKTEKQLLAEVQALRAVKPTVRQFSIFQDDHHAAIDAQLLVLEDLAGDCDVFFDEESIEAEAEIREWPENVREAALEAFRWAEGRLSEEAPSEAWKPLVRK